VSTLAPVGADPFGANPVRADLRVRPNLLRLAVAGTAIHFQFRPIPKAPNFMLGVNAVPPACPERSRTGGKLALSTLVNRPGVIVPEKFYDFVVFFAHLFKTS
jgi:hypothetical protein